MESLQVCFRAVFPLFLLLALGYTAQRTGVIRRQDVSAMNKVVFRCFMSVTMFQNIYTSRRSELMQPELLLFGVAGALAVYGLAVVWVLLTEPSEEKRGVKIQGIYRSNFLLLGLPLAQALSGGKDMGAVTLLLAIVIPAYNVLAVITLEAFRGGRPKPGQILLNLAKNPLILGAAAGLLCQLTNLRLPSVLETATKQISSVSTPMMLFLLGAFFRFDGLRRYRKDLLEICTARLVLVPGVMLTAAYFLGIRGVGFAGLIGLFGSSTAVTSFTMTQEIGGDAELAGDIVVATSAVCVLTLFLWSLLFRTVGAF